MSDTRWLERFTVASDAHTAKAMPRSACRVAGHAGVLLVLAFAGAGCSSEPERKRHPSEVAPVQTRDTTLGRPSVSGGYSAPGGGLSEPDLEPVTPR